MTSQNAERTDHIGSPAPYRKRLELLAAGEVERRLDAWAARNAVERGGPWRRAYGKLRPGRSPWALLVYDAHGVPTVQVRLLESGDTASTGPGLDASDGGELGRVEIGACVDDSKLPGLREVLAILDAAEVVRYHPGHRCTVRGRIGSEARFVKVFAEDVDDQVEAQARWRASEQGLLPFAVARPHGWDAGTRSSWYGAVPGEPLEDRLGDPAATGLVHRVGAALGGLAAAPLTPARTDDARHQLSRTRRALDRAVAADPGLADELQAAFGRLVRTHERLDARGHRPLVPIHGAAHLGQWLVDDRGGLGLVDFDRFAMGEPEFDLATFVVELRACSNETGEADATRLEQSVVDGFVEVVGPVDEERFEIYLVHKRLARIARSAAGLSPDGGRRARELLADLEPTLRALPAP